jgi:hypothetical protein
MRTMRFVTALTFLLLAVGLATGAESALDREITLVGRDEAMLSVPKPATPPPVAIPDLDPRRSATPVAPPVAVKTGEWGFADPSEELPV